MDSILIKGIGSIGRRHCSNLLGLGFDQLVLVSGQSEFPSEWPSFPVYKEVKDALANHQISHGIIASPTAYHMNDLEEMLSLGIKNIYLEKPVSHNLEKVEELLEISRGKAKVIIGFDLHYDPGLIKVKELMDQNVLGKIYSANAFVGQYLPDWRPHEDYKKGMSASIEKGGGVMLDLVHEFDYLCWLLGNPKQVAAIYQNNRELGIETEDLADVLIGFENGITGTIHLDYHQKSLIRNCVLTGQNASIIWDLGARTVIVQYKSGEREEFDFSQFERNDRYVSIMKDFMKGANDKKLTSFENGIKSLKLVLAAKKASEQSTMIQL